MEAVLLHPDDYKRLAEKVPPAEGTLSHRVKAALSICGAVTSPAAIEIYVHKRQEKGVMTTGRRSEIHAELERLHALEGGESGGADTLPES